MSIRRNTLFNIFGSALPLAASLVTIPLYLGLIGEARYGVLAIAWLLLGYFGLFDLGLGRATAQRMAALGDSAGSERAATFWTALALNAMLGVLGGLLIWPIAHYFFGHVFKVDDALRPEVQAAVPWLVLAVPIATLSGVLSGALQGRERFLALNLISVWGTVLFQVLPLAVAKVGGPDLTILLPAALLARVITLLILLERCRRHIFVGHAITLARSQVGHLLRFGGWVTVTAFIGPMMVVLDRLIIGAVSGARAVAHYTVPFQLAERSTIVSGALTFALFPRFAAATIQEEQRLAQESLRALVAFMTPLVVVGILLMEPFLVWWISADFARQSAPLGRIILLGFWANGFALIPYAQLQARGRPDLVAKCHLAEVLPYFGLLYVGLTTLGMAGAALAFSLRVIVDFALLAGLAGVLRSALANLFVAAVLLGAAFLTATLSTPGAPVWFVLAIIILLLSLIWAIRQSPDALRQFLVARSLPVDQTLKKS